jgi:hypothetical protein
MTSAVYVRVETEFVQDAIDTVERIHKALTNRHGSPFRILEAEIEHLVDSGEVSAGDLVDLGEGILAAQPSATVIDIIRRARALGVI